MVAVTGFEPASHGYEPCKETTPPYRDIYMGSFTAYPGGKLANWRILALEIF